MRNVMWIWVVLCVGCGGCEGFRFAASERQKANAYVHERTASAAAQTAEVESASPRLQSLTRLSELQSRAFVADYGLPRELPVVETVEQIVADDKWELARNAEADSLEKPTGWDVADAMLEVAIGVSGLVGGVYGARAAGYLKRARQNAAALREIITGNELFKRQNADQAQAFKAAQSAQSPETRRIVSEMKTG